MDKVKNSDRLETGGWGRRSGAVILIGLGLFLLLVQTGIVSWDMVGSVSGTFGNMVGTVFGGIGEAIGFVFDRLGSVIGNLWPLVLIALGLFILWRGNRSARHS